MLEAAAFANDTSMQLNRLGANNISNSKIIHDNNVTVFERHRAVK